MDLNVLHAITKERDKQDEQWGGPAHDDAHITLEWVSFIQKQLTYVKLHSMDAERQRERFVKVAALAVAAIESIDRELGRSE